MKAIVLFAHGSRDPLWHRPMQAVAERVAALQPDVPVACAYLELCQPSLPEAAAAFIAAGASHVRVFPLFLGVGKHAREDLPLIMEEIRARHPEVRLELLPTAGESPQLTSLLASIALA